MKLVITENITLDGVVEAVSDWFSPAGDQSDMSDIQAKLHSIPIGGSLADLCKQLTLCQWQQHRCDLSILNLVRVPRSGSLFSKVPPNRCVADRLDRSDFGIWKQERFLDLSMWLIAADG